MRRVPVGSVRPSGVVRAPRLGVARSEGGFLPAVSRVWGGWTGRDSFVLLMWIAVRSAVAGIAVMLFALSTLTYQPGERPAAAGDVVSLTPGLHAAYAAPNRSQGPRGR